MCNIWAPRLQGSLSVLQPQEKRSCVSALCLCPEICGQHVSWEPTGVSGGGAPTLLALGSVLLAAGSNQPRLQGEKKALHILLWCPQHVSKLVWSTSSPLLPSPLHCLSHLLGFPLAPPCGWLLISNHQLVQFYVFTCLRLCKTALSCSVSQTLFTPSPIHIRHLMA